MRPASVSLVVSTDWGPFTVEATARGICGVRPTSGAAAIPVDEISSEPAQAGARQLSEYIRGVRKVFTVPVDLSAHTQFQQDVLATLMTVPFGCGVSYGELAAASGHPGAARAVGTALSRNRALIVVPCHRVIAADGGRGGWSGPEGLKERLMSHEKISWRESR